MMPISPDDVLQSNNLNLDTLLEKAKIPVFEVQYNSKTNSICFNYCSKQILEIFEISEEAFYENNAILISRLHKDEKVRIIKGFAASFLNQSTWITDFKIETPSHGLRHLNVQTSIEVIGVDNYLLSGYLSDITEQYLVEDELQEKRERLAMAFENSRDGVWDWNVKSGSVFYSQESLAIVGHDRNSFPKSSDAWDDLVHPEDKKAYFQDIQDHFDGKTPYYTNEHRVLCIDGSYKWILDRGKVIERSHNGNPLRVIGTHTEITEQKNREEAISQTVETVASQNQRLLNFAHIVSHNLRSHSGNFESILNLMNACEDVHEKLEYVQYLKKISASLAETIVHLNEVVTVQTTSKNILARVNITKCIESTRHALYADIVASNATLINRVEEHHRVMYNPAYLDSIVLNFISNGIKYRHSDRPPVIEIFTEFDEGCLVLVFKDNGTGIDLEKYGHRLFGMYQTFHSNEDARGVGLFITKNQIESMGGTVKISSTVGVGTEFRVYFDKATH